MCVLFFFLFFLCMSGVGMSDMGVGGMSSGKGRVRRGCGWP